MPSTLPPQPRSKSSRPFLLPHGRASKDQFIHELRFKLPVHAAPRQVRPTRHDKSVPGVDPVSIPEWKHWGDMLGVILILPLALVFAALVCCWIKLVSPGPCTFRQTRIGRGGKPFTMFKLRTMTPGARTAEHEAHVSRLIKTNLPMTKLDEVDDRLIKGARLIRNLGLDELPQLVNVLRGEMSLVGPRPCTPQEFRCYDTDHYRRFAVQPGLTGLWQVERTQVTTFREMMGMDIAYIDRMSPWTDFKILMKTPIALIEQILPAIQPKSNNRQSGAIGEPPPERPADFLSINPPDVLSETKQ